MTQEMTLQDMAKISGAMSREQRQELIAARIDGTIAAVFGKDIPRAMNALHPLTGALETHAAAAQPGVRMTVRQLFKKLTGWL